MDSAPVKLGPTIGGITFQSEPLGAIQFIVDEANATVTLRLADAPDSGSNGAPEVQRPFFAVANGHTLYVASGLVLSPFVSTPSFVVASASGAPSDTHAWLKVEWSGGTLSSAAIEFGTAWPSPLYSVASSYAKIPLAYISAGTLLRLCTTNITLHRVFVSGGAIFWPLHK